MPSAALIEWQTTRANRIDDLLEAHVQVGGVGAGRRWRTEQLNWALILRVAAEFQGYCRDLHDLAADEVAVAAGQLNGPLQLVVRGMLTEGRRLSSGNAGPGHLGSDFGRFGLSLWPELNARWPSRAVGWNRQLEALNDARNAIAHADHAKIVELESRGYRLAQLRTIKRFRSSVNGLASGMDEVLGSYLYRLLGGPGPW